MAEVTLLLDREALEQLIRLHQSSYALLKWVGQSLETGKLSFSVVHASLSTAEAVEEWLTRHYESLPRDLRPSRSEIRAFAHLFASYLTTSFTLPPTPTLKVSRPCCGCDCCSFLSTSHRLVPRDPSSKDQAQAHRLKVLCLEALAESIGQRLTPTSEAAIMGSKALSVELAHLSYAFELRRRCEFASQGPGVLALWRSIAWEAGRPNRKFKYTAERVLKAQSLLEATLAAT